jgi:diguanylate cyclase (GGDEF)-like protein/PAS domain S-box-containing protein
MTCTQLEPGTRAPAEAREFVSSLLVDAPDELRARACQVVTELVTNSVRHAGATAITVEAEVDPNGAVDIDVRDDGGGFDVQPRAPGHAETRGWGLLFVDLLTESWAAGGPGSPIVWAHLEPRSIADEPAQPDPIMEKRMSELLDVRMLLDSVKDYAIFALDRGGRITLWNAGGERLTGYPAEEMLGSSINVLHQDETVSNELSVALARGRLHYERWLYRKDGSRFWGDAVVTPILDSRGGLRGFSVVARDITWRKQLDEQRDGLIARIKHLARSDDLTGLPNRRRWHEELDRELARARRTLRPVCVAMVDLDGFKAYNDEHGHLAGDELLTRTARSWADAVRATDMLARYGGDEFSVILPDCPLDEALTVVERLRQATPAPVTCSAGVASSDGAEPAEALVRRADSALYGAKRDGRDMTAAGG